MLEHADRDDPVELRVERAVVGELEARAPLKTALARALIGDRMLLGRKRDAGHLHVEEVGKENAEAAPAGADVEDVLAGLERKLGGEMALLGPLRFFETGARPVEIGAGILHVGIEEEAVDAPVEIVVVLDVAPRAEDRVVLREPSRREAQPRGRLVERQLLDLAPVLVDEHQELEERVLGEHDRCRPYRPRRWRDPGV